VLAPSIALSETTAPQAEFFVWVFALRAADDWNYLRSWLIAVSVPRNATRIPSRSPSS